MSTSVSAQGTPVQTLSFDGWVDRVWPAVKAGPARKARVLARDAARKEAQAANLEDPWLLSISPSRTDVGPRALQDETVSSVQYGLGNEVKYSGASGLQGSLRETTSTRATKNDVVVEETGPKTDDTYHLTHKLEGQVSYDVWNRSYRSPARLRLAVAAADAEARAYAAEDSLLAFELDAFGTLVEIFFQKCNLDTIKPALQLVDDTVRKGAVQQQSNIISYKDYLNFLNLKINIEQRVMNANLNLRRSLEQLRASGQAFELAQAALAEPLACEFDSSRVLQSAASSLADATKAPFNARQLKSAEVAAKAAQLRVRASDPSHLMTMAPFVSGEWSPAIDRGTESGSTTIGVAWTWTLPAGRGQADFEAQKEQLGAAQAEVATTKERIKARLMTMGAELESGQALLPSTESLLKNADQMIEATRSQLLTGSIDSLQFTTSYISRIDSLVARNSLIASLLKLRFEADAGRLDADPLTK